MQKHLRLEITLHTKQHEFYSASERFLGYIGGIGSGKSFVGCLKGLQIALDNPGSLGMIIAPTYKMLRDSTLRSFLQVCPEQLIKHYSRSQADMSITLTNGSEILFRSADNPESLRGPSLTWFLLDEAGLMDVEAWKIAIGRLRQAAKQHYGLITTTPKGFNWIYDEFVLKNDSYHKLIHSTTMDNRVNLPEGFIESLESQYAGAFKEQELMGQFVGFEGRVYQDFNRATHVLDLDKVPERSYFKEIIGGVDFGFTNPSVILAIGLDGDGRAYVLDEIYQRQMSIDQFIGTARMMKEKWGIHLFYADPSEPAMIKNMNEKGIPTEAAWNDVLPGIVEVASRLIVQKDQKPRLYVSRACANTIMEFEMYRYKDKKPDKEEKEEPLKVMDHAMDALRYPLFSLKKGKLQMAVGFSGTDNLLF